MGNGLELAKSSQVNLFDANLKHQDLFHSRGSLDFFCASFRSSLDSASVFTVHPLFLILYTILFCQRFVFFSPEKSSQIRKTTSNCSVAIVETNDREDRVHSRETSRKRNVFVPSFPLFASQLSLELFFFRLGVVNDAPVARVPPTSLFERQLNGCYLKPQLL